MALAHFNPSADRHMASPGPYPSYNDQPVYSMSQYFGAAHLVDQPYVSHLQYPPSPEPARHHWSQLSSPSYTTLDPDPVDAYSASSSSSHLAYPADYPESSQRTIMSGSLSAASSSPSYSAVLSHNPPSNIPTLQRASWSGSALYVIPPDPEAPPSPATSAHALKVKAEEEPEGTFIFEMPCPRDRPSTQSSTLSPSMGRSIETSAFMTDLPLQQPPFDAMPALPFRAIHAPKAMRKLMGLYRLNPFAMHNGIHSAAVTAPPEGIEVGPLREEPVMLEFQVHLDYPLVPPSPPWSSPRSSSPPMYAMQDDTEDKWAPPLERYESFDAVEQPDFEPVMTPAQSLRWSNNMSYASDHAHAHAHAHTADPPPYAGQPLSIFGFGSVPSSHGLPSKSEQNQHQHQHQHPHPSHLSPGFSDREAYRMSSAGHGGYLPHSHAQNSARPTTAAAAAARCQQEYSEYSNVVPGGMTWYRKTLALAETQPYTACT